MQAYAACDDPEIREVVRNGYGDLVTYVERVTDLPAEAVAAFFAKGMLLNVIASMGLGDEHRALGRRVCSRAAGSNRRVSFFQEGVSDESQIKTQPGQARTIWTFAITSIALFMVTLDNLVVTTALPVIRTDLDAGLERARVDRQRLHADLRGAAPDGRRARRPLRAAAHVRARPRDLHARLGRRPRSRRRSRR